MKSLVKYLRQQLNFYQASRWLKANSASAIAAHCMFHLNRLAKNYGGGREAIYSLKNNLVKTLYLQGYCYMVTEQYQRLECWSCGGTGEYWTGEYCYKCDGTGVYRSYRLYQFSFRIHGHRYNWHQPFGLVDWPVTLTQEAVGEYEKKHGLEVSLSPELVSLYSATVYLFLIEQGVPSEELPQPVTLKQAVCQDLKRFWLVNVKFRIRDLKESEVVVNGRRLWRFLRTGEMPERYEVFDDEIPF